MTLESFRLLGYVYRRKVNGNILRLKPQFPTNLRSVSVTFVVQTGIVDDGR